MPEPEWTPRHRWAPPILLSRTPRDVVPGFPVASLQDTGRFPKILRTSLRPPHPLRLCVKIFPRCRRRYRYRNRSMMLCRMIVTSRTEAIMDRGYNSMLIFHHPGTSSRPNLWPPFRAREQPRCRPSHLCAFVLKAFDQAYDKARDEEWLNLNVGCWMLSVEC